MQHQDYIKTFNVILGKHSKKAFSSYAEAEAYMMYAGGTSVDLDAVHVSDGSTIVCTVSRLVGETVEYWYPEYTQA